MTAWLIYWTELRRKRRKGDADRRPELRGTIRVPFFFSDGKGNGR